MSDKTWYDERIEGEEDVVYVVGNTRYHVDKMPLRWEGDDT